MREPVQNSSDPLIELVDDIAGFTHDPLGHALYAYPWGSGLLAGASGPRQWQRDTMAIIKRHLSDPSTRFDPLRIGIASGHGIGKSALIAMISKWALDTCEDCRVVVTANTEPQLRTKTMPEISKWHRLAITSDWFKANAMSLNSTVAGHSKAWSLDAITWSENNTEAFAGLHNLGKRIVLIFDEASGIHQKVWEVALGALTDEDTEIIWLAFGNPTQNTGEFRNCFGKARNLWRTRQIDSRTVEGTNKAYLDSLVEAYGADSDIVKVRVRGMFPSASSLQFIPSSMAEAARTRPDPPEIITTPLIYGVDCARFGDDHSTLAKRCGRDARSRPWKRWHGIDAMTLAGEIAREADVDKPDAIFIDAGNIGAAVVDRLRQLKLKNVFEVWFGAPGREVEWIAGQRIKTVNKRTEMWASMRAWLDTGVIPDEQVIEDDLIGVEYGYDAGEQAIALEKKKHMKARGLASPDDADALACTFAEFVPPRAVPAGRDPGNYRSEDYDRFAEIRS